MCAHCIYLFCSNRILFVYCVLVHLFPIFSVLFSCLFSTPSPSLRALRRLFSSFSFGWFVGNIPLYQTRYMKRFTALLLLFCNFSMLAYVVANDSLYLSHIRLKFYVFYHIISFSNCYLDASNGTNSLSSTFVISCEMNACNELFLPKKMHFDRSGCWLWILNKWIELHWFFSLSLFLSLIVHFQLNWLSLFTRIALLASRIIETKTGWCIWLVDFF